MSAVLLPLSGSELLILFLSGFSAKYLILLLFKKNLYIFYA